MHQGPAPGGSRVGKIPLKILFISHETQLPLLTLEDGSLVPPAVPRKGEPVFIGGRGTMLVKFVRWVYSEGHPPAFPPRLDKIEIVLD